MQFDWLTDDYLTGPRTLSFCQVELSLLTAFWTACILVVISKDVASLCASKARLLSRSNLTPSNFGLGAVLEFGAFPDTECAKISFSVNNLRSRMLTVLNSDVELLISA